MSSTNGTLNGASLTPFWVSRKFWLLIATLVAIVALALLKESFEITATEIIAFVTSYMGLHTVSDVGGQWINARHQNNGVVPPTGEDE